MSAKSKAAVEKHLNVSTKNQSLWLVKIPTFVGERWADAQSEDLLGSLSINTVALKPNAPPVKQISVRLANDKGEPEEFTLEELSASEHQQLLAFKFHENSESFSIQGQVSKNLSLQPKETRQYRETVRERGIRATTRQESQHASQEDVSHGKSGSNTVDFIPPAHAELKRKTQEQQYANKMGRNVTILDVSELRNKVFEAFAAKEKYTLKELSVICKDVPGFAREKELRDLLEIYGKYHARGPYQRFWELKLEYRDHTQPPPIAT
jgi:hypothetical protein